MNQNEAISRIIKILLRLAIDQGWDMEPEDSEKFQNYLWLMEADNLI